MRARIPTCLTLLIATSLGGCLDIPEDQSTIENPLTSGEDLVVTTVGDPPATATIGQMFAVVDTTQNIGTADAGASWTKYYLSLDGTHGAYLLGARSVPALMVSASDSGGATVTLPPGVPDGQYFVLACADRGPGTAGGISEVEETNENNNCRASTNTVGISGPDLIASNVSVSPAVVDVNTGTLTISDTVTNSGSAAAGASLTRWYLSPDALRNSNDAYIRNCINGGPVPQRSVGALAVGANDSGSASTMPLCVRDATGLHPPTAGVYYVIACADAAETVAESNEKNQCAVSSNTFEVTECGNGAIETGEMCDDGNTVNGDGCSATCGVEVAPTVDLVTSTVSNPPATASVGSTFTVTDTIQNAGTAGAAASTTYYYLSSDQIRNSNDRQLTGSRTVPALNPGASDTGSAMVTIPGAIPAGNWYLLTCADGPGTVSESSDTNNCLASATTLSISGADLVISSVSNPPPTATVGSTFAISDTTSNIGQGGASSFYNKYYLSTNGTKPTAYLATRSVGALGAGQNNSATFNVTIGAGTTSGVYYVLACADRGPGTSGGTSEVPETDENNNCTASASTISIAGPDLVVSSVGNPPSTAMVGGSFTITDTTANSGTANSPSFFNKYYLSSDGTRAVAYLATRSIGALNAGASNTGSVTATIGTSTAPGTYFLLACADRGPGTSGGISQVPETNENNNCRAAAATVVVTN